MLEGKKILLGITGSIAAYKSVHLVRLLVKGGAEVRVMMTPSAQDFVTPLTLSTLSKNPVLRDLFDEQSWSNHVMLGRWADIMLIAPLSCNTLAKMAHGQCDNLLLATYLSATCPVMVAPAMDEDMWHHPSTANNLRLLESFGNIVIPVAKGELASGLFGDGRMAEPEQLVRFLEEKLSSTKPLSGRKALVTAGPTYEAIDPVRFIGNHSSGKMGIAIAKELYRQGAEVTLVAGPLRTNFRADGIRLVSVTSAAEMYEACQQAFGSADLAVMSAAVADYTPVVKAQEKIKKKEDHFNLELTRTKDILKSLGEKKKAGQIVVGFALETTDERNYALGKLEAKNADMIVLNSLNDAGAGFGGDTNKVTIFQRGGKELRFDTKTKEEVARDIVDTIISSYYA
ncbi:bifunctional phosphopantothenoylcysteine decarboxylase/phosphopantothenate--cysteine ligase CoaBC [Terrimonas sp. NA20]|uniref:Coenzyme A biosynthesis bifunctional protein CoaBC n=1 Tax=Terrimonas ginsenosidimutans TaxID=2908004 RepID=A0ABS9KPE0_9BACT|nr:bifunctional phosphopantothenoylcysteine decarboxylase/phosphopantothenate--cysteine ligase CoaBC [Terrimonas ginsenosidimutans]MCG2614197.1 bifunctional phosphopantothenoylcysteine decarboxylase/phosphopantothenate--cysteine ligase CoaBC [Terrimonas ginsenosidimutans]